MSLKTCSRCGIKKPMEDFSRQSSSKDGRQCYCGPCAKKVLAAWRKENPEKFSMQQENYYRQAMPDLLAYQRKYRRANRKANLARGMINDHARRGKEVPLKICLVCSTTEKVVYHHPDYDRPLFVDPVCQFHHSQRHKIINDTKQAVEDSYAANEQKGQQRAL